MFPLKNADMTKKKKVL